MMVRGPESLWRDEAWNWVDDEAAQCPHGKESDQVCDICDLRLLWAARGVEPYSGIIDQPRKREHIAAWLALVFVALAAALGAIGALLYSQVIGL